MRACALPLMLLLAGMLLSAGSAQCDDGASPPAAAAQTRARPAGGEGASAEARAQIEALQQDLDALRTEYESRISDLERKIEELSSTGGAGEEMDIRRAAEEAAAAAGAGTEDESDETATEETVFKSGALGLQALNPEISVVGDFTPWIGDADEGGRHSDLGLRVLGLHLESYLDPYSKFKASVPVTEDGAELGEAYITRYDAGRNLNVTLGKFHQQFGVVNRWHAPGLDQVEYPLALRQIFGGPLEATGVSLDWTGGGSSSASQGVTLQ